MKTTAKKTTIPATIGTPFAGGYYAGRFYDAGKPYALILAPKADGEKEAIAWSGASKLVKGALSYSAGPANTAAMAKAGSALAKWALGLNIGGFKDWYVPSRLEALLLFGELKLLKAFEPEQPDGIGRDWHWTSTQCADAESYAWCQHFSYGGQDGTLKGYKLRARAVRRISI